MKAGDFYKLKTGQKVTVVIIGEMKVVARIPATGTVIVSDGEGYWFPHFKAVRVK